MNLARIEQQPLGCSFSFSARAMNRYTPYRIHTEFIQRHTWAVTADFKCQTHHKMIPVGVLSTKNIQLVWKYIWVQFGSILTQNFIQNSYRDTQSLYEFCMKQILFTKSSFGFPWYILSVLANYFGHFHSLACQIVSFHTRFIQKSYRKYQFPLFVESVSNFQHTTSPSMIFGLSGPGCDANLTATALGPDSSGDILQKSYRVGQTLCDFCMDTPSAGERRDCKNSSMTVARRLVF